MAWSIGGASWSPGARWQHAALTQDVMHAVPVRPVRVHRRVRPLCAIASDNAAASTAEAVTEPSQLPVQGSTVGPMPDQDSPPQTPASASQPAGKKKSGKPFTSIYWWPRTREARERPAFLEQYPARGGRYNINSFMGKFDTHGGKFYVPPKQYQRFLQQYFEAFKAGHQLFCAEMYGSQPFRYFVELDFKWDLPKDEVEAAFDKLYPIIRRAVRETYGLMALPMMLVSMRTPYKVHLNCPALVTTELRAMMCREKILEYCRNEMPYAWDWESIVDFPHGSFRMLGSRKTRNMKLNAKEPSWVADLAYYPVRLDRSRGVWVPDSFTLDRVLQSSIIPTSEQLQRFEKSSAYLGMIYADASEFERQVQEKLRRRLEAQTAELQRLEAQFAGQVGAAAGGRSSGLQHPAADNGGDLHTQRVAKAQLDKMNAVALAALKQQEEQAMRHLASQCGAVGQQYLTAVEELDKLTELCKAKQKRLALLMAHHARTQAAAAVTEPDTDPALRQGASAASNTTSSDSSSGGAGAVEGGAQGAAQSAEDEAQELEALKLAVKALMHLVSERKKQVHELRAQVTGGSAPPDPTSGTAPQQITPGPEPTPATPPQSTQSVLSEAPSTVPSQDVGMQGAGSHCEVPTEAAPSQLDDLLHRLSAAKLHLRKVASPHDALAGLHEKLRQQGREPAADDVRLLQELKEMIVDRSEVVGQLEQQVKALSAQTPPGPVTSSSEDSG